MNKILYSTSNNKELYKSRVFPFWSFFLHPSGFCVPLKGDTEAETSNLVERLTGDIGTLPHYHSTREEPGVFVLVDYQGRCQGMLKNWNRIVKNAWQYIESSCNMSSEYPKGCFLMADHCTYYSSKFNSILPSGSRGIGVGLLLCVAVLGLLEYWMWCLGQCFLICIWWQEKEAFNLWSEASQRLSKKWSYIPSTHSVTRKLLLEQKEEGSEIKQVPIYPFPDTISHKYT